MIIEFLKCSNLHILYVNKKLHKICCAEFPSTIQLRHFGIIACMCALTFSVEYIQRSVIVSELTQTRSKERWQENVSLYHIGFAYCFSFRLLLFFLTITSCFLHYVM